jgi:hypothetical protein
MRAGFDHNIEAQPLFLAAFLLKRANIGLDDMIAQADPVARIGAGRSLRPFFGMGKSKADISGHLRLRTGRQGRVQVSRITRAPLA